MAHELATRVSGVAFAPDDARYADEVVGFNLAISHTPDVVVGAASADDVVEAVRFAAANGLPVRVMATGHGDHVPVTDGVLITTRRMQRLEVDAGRRVATIGAGVRWGDVVEATAPFGLAPITGSSPTVGAVGYLLGGGLGPLARSHGFSSDRLLGATVVTADGEVVDASPDGDAELYWALRGGKGGFGVVTEVRVELVDIPELYAGSVTFDGAHAEAVLRGWLDWTATAPDDVSTSLVQIRFPDLEFLPPPVRGRFLVTVRFAFPGPVAEGERLAAPLRALAPVEVDTVRAMPLAEVASIHADPTDPGPSWGWGALLDHVDQDFATALLGQFHPASPLPLLGVELRHLGAATARDVDGGSAVGGRDGAFSIFTIGAPDPALFAEVLPRATAGFAAALQPWLSASSNIHFIDHFANAEQFAAAWPPATFARLAEVRSRVDPHGIFPFGPH